MLIYIVLMIVFGLIGAAIASSKNRNVFGWSVLCALFPLIGIIILLCMPGLENESTALLRKQLEIQQEQAISSSRNSAQPEDLMECPKCAELIKQKALVCRFCKYELEI